LNVKTKRKNAPNVNRRLTRGGGAGIPKGYQSDLDKDETASRGEAKRKGVRQKKKIRRVARIKGRVDRVKFKDHKK